MNAIAATLAMLICLGISTDAQADVPATMTYHGTLSDGAGSPVDATVGATFRIYDAQSGGSEVWSEEFATIDINTGSFSVQLGATESLVEVFDGSPYWLEVSIDGETLSPRTAVESVPYALRADRANDADTLAGQTPSQLTASVPTTAADLDYDNTNSGLSATNVQAALDELAQLRARVDALETNMTDSSGNAVTLADLDARITQNAADTSSQASDISTLQSDVATLQTDVTTNQGAVTTLQSDVATLQTGVTANQSAVSTLQSNVATLQTDVATLQTGVSANQGDIVANTNAISTNAGAISALETLTQEMSRTTINGQPAVVFTGVNVHVRNGLGATDGDTGSGPQVNGVGNLVVGYDETRVFGDASDKSGSHNLVVGIWHEYTSHGGLIAGARNTNTAPYASVTGGRFNTASNSYASVSGGNNNIASGTSASVSGGYANTASGQRASISAGRANTASGTYTSISGGISNTADNDSASVSGGSNNTASGIYSSISGGYANTASSASGSVSGGVLNTASGTYASVSGGNENTASGFSASVGGGYINTVTGVASSISGGQNDTLTGDYDWRAGDLIELD